MSELKIGAYFEPDIKMLTESISGRRDKGNNRRRLVTTFEDVKL